MKLTKNFSKHEFDCKDGSDMPSEVLVNVKELANNLQVVRDLVCEVISINSAYRSPSHNKAVGGAKNSLHLQGKAADIVIENYTPSQVYYILKQLIREDKISEGGLSEYKTFVHYDIRKTRARW